VNSFRLEKLFEEVNEANIDYVVPRKHSNLPKEPKGDIDILVKEEFLDEFTEISKALGFKTDKRRKSGHKLAIKAVKNPIKASKAVRNYPIKILRQVSVGEPVSDTSNLKLGHKNIKLEKDSVDLDIRNNLAYKSPQNGKRYPVDLQVTDWFFERTQNKNGVVIPTPDNELGHIIPHCIFDKKGVFSEYYLQRCNELSEIVLNNTEYDEHFRRILSRIFYDAAELVYELTEERRYQEMREELRRYEEY